MTLSEAEQESITRWRNLAADPEAAAAAISGQIPLGTPAAEAQATAVHHFHGQAATLEVVNAAIARKRQQAGKE